MTTQYTSILKLALPVQGELSGTWGDVVNNNITSMVEEAIAGRAVINTWTTNSHTLTSADGTTSESRCAMLEFTDTGTALTGDATVVCPTAAKIYICKNDAGQKVTIKTSAGTGVAIADGQTMFVFCDGTNVVEAVTSMSSLKLGTAVTSIEVTSILDEDDLVSDSATALATQQSIKAYVDAQVTAQDLDFGGDSGTGSVDLDSQTFTIAGTSNEIETSASGQTLTVGLPAAVTVTTSVTTPTVQTTNLNANDGTSAVTIADTTGQTTITDAVLTTADINGGTADNVVIGGTTAAAGSFTTVGATGNITSEGQVITDTINEQTATSGVTVDGVLLKDGGATLTGDLTVDTDTLYVDSANNRVGIGTTSASSFSVGDLVVGSGSGARGITIYSGNASGIEGIIRFADGVTGDEQYRGQIKYDQSTDIMKLLVAGTGSTTPNVQISSTETMFNEGGLDRDFRVESDNNTHALFVDAGEDRIGMFNGTPRVKLDIYGDTMPDAGDAATVEDMLTLYKGGSPTVWSGGATLAVGRFSNSSTSNPDTRLDFKLKNLGGSNTALPETTVMTLQSNGAVGIGTVAPQTALHLYSSSQSILRIEGTGVSGAYLQLRDNDTTSGSFGWIGMDANTMKFFSDNTNLTIAATSSEVSINDAGVDMDFRVESSNFTHALFVDAQYSVVGVNSSITDTNDGGGGLVVGGNTTSNEGAISIVNASFKTGGGEGGVGALTWNRGGNSSERGVPLAALRGIDRYSGSTFIGALDIYTQLGNSEDRKMRFDHTDIIVNPDSNDRNFRVSADTETHALYVDAGNNSVSINTSQSSNALALNVKGYAGYQDIAGYRWVVGNVTSVGVNANQVYSAAGGFVAAGAKVGDEISISGTSNAINTVTAVTDTVLTLTNNWTQSFAGVSCSGFSAVDISAGYNTRLGVRVKADGSVIINENGNAVQDFRVESDNNANILFVDAGTNRIGINDSAPQQKVSIIGGGSTSSTLELCGTNNDSSANDNSTISAPFSIVAQVNNGRAGNQTNRSFSIKDGGSGYSDGTSIILFKKDDDLANSNAARIETPNGITYRGTYAQGNSVYWAKGLYSTVSTTNRTFTLLTVTRNSGNNRVWIKVTMRAAGAVGNNGNESVAYALINADGGDASRTGVSSTTDYGNSPWSYACSFTLSWDTSSDPDKLQVTTVKNANYVALSFDVETVSQDGNAEVNFAFDT